MSTHPEDPIPAVPPPADPEPAGPVRVRFAPAPTGYLHLGGARTALFNWLFARNRKGVFILRIEDTDLERNREEAAAQVIEGLRWLGLDWDEGPEIGGSRGPYYQSLRRESHLAAVRRLVDAGRAYECYMTPEELEGHRAAAKAAGRPFHYEGWHRELSSEKIAAFRAEGRRPAIRLRVDAPESGEWIVEDLVKGRTRFPAEQVDDFVLVRSDGTPSFHLANVADDADMGITHVLRGEDHLVNTVRHQLLFAALDRPAPAYGHLPMILGPDRAKLSKRHGAVGVQEYRDQGYLPDAMVNELALLGWSPADGKEILERAELIERFSLDRCGSSASIFDFAKLDHLNKVRLHALPAPALAAAVRPFAEAEGLPGAATEPMAELVREELVRLSDFPAAARRVLDPPAWDDPALMSAPEMAGARTAVEAFAGALVGWGEAAWERPAVKSAMQAAAKSSGLKGKAFFLPLRAAMTGREHGPALDGTIHVLGREPALARARGFLARLAAEDPAHRATPSGEVRNPA